MKDETENEHVTTAELAAYVSDMAAPNEACRLEAHVAVCVLCAAALADEARIELALREAVRAPKTPRVEPVRLRDPIGSPRSPDRSRKPVAALVASLAAAAAFLALTYQSVHFRGPGDSQTAPSRSQQPSGSEIRIECAARNEAAWRDCRHRARCSGELVEDGTNGRDVPAYESLLAECKRPPGSDGQLGSASRP